MCFFYITLASSVKLGLRHLLTHSLILSLSSLFSSSGKALSCRLIPSLTNLLIWTIVELCKSTILSGLGLKDILVLIIGSSCAKHQGTVDLS